MAGKPDRGIIERTTVKTITRRTARLLLPEVRHAGRVAAVSPSGQRLAGPPRRRQAGGGTAVQLPCAAGPLCARLSSRCQASPLLLCPEPGAAARNADRVMTDACSGLSARGQAAMAGQRGPARRRRMTGPAGEDGWLTAVAATARRRQEEDQGKRKPPVSGPAEIPGAGAASRDARAARQPHGARCPAVRADTRTAAIAGPGRRAGYPAAQSSARPASLPHFPVIAGHDGWLSGFSRHYGGAMSRNTKDPVPGARPPS